MKKLMLVLAVMLMTVPAMAAVTITAADNADCSASISYTSDGTLPRAFALNITVDGGAVITGVDTTGAQPFNIYLGTIQIDATGVVTDAGTPVAPATDPGALGGIGTSGITIEMGSLYDKNANPIVGQPAASGLLIKVTVNQACNLSIASNTTRQNVVLEDATVVAPTMTGTAITCAPPACLGDMDGDGWITLDDLNLIVNELLPTDPDWYISIPPGTAAGDMDGDGWLTLDDLNLVVNLLLPTDPDWYLPCP